MHRTLPSPALALCVTTILTSPITAYGDAAAVPALTPGATWVVEQTTHLSTLTIPAGAHIVTSPGHDLTLTVDGVGTAISAGTYQGDMVLTVTADIPVKFETLDPYHYRAAVYVDGSGYVAEKSVAAAVVGGQVTNAAASNISITSNEEKFNGILVTGDARYVIENPSIALNGNGGNDFAGFGAAIMSSGQADVTVEKARITTRGAIRTGVFVGGDSTMRVNDSSIEVFNGTLPADYRFNIDAGKMMEVPWMLGLTGNVRATNLVGHGTVYYNRSHIKAQAWGALSADGPQALRMYATDSIIETVESGYGAYSIGNSIDHFSHCTFNVADVGLIIAADGSGIFTDGTVVNSRRFGVMMHSGIGGGRLIIDKGSIFNTRSTAIQVKGRGANILVDHARINAANGIILQAMINDDPMAPTGPLPGAPAPTGASGSSSGADSAAVPGDVSSTVNATFRNTTLKGDIINSRTSQGDMRLTLESAHLAGAITTATAVSSTGKVPTAQTYYLIGDVKNTFGATKDQYGLRLSLDRRSSWTVSQTSFVTQLTLTKGATITAPAGYTITLRVNGVRAPLQPGTYTGNVVLQVKHT